MNKKFNVCVVGATGAVGETILSILDERDFPTTERYSVQALCQHLSDKFGLQHQFIDIDNIV